MTLDVLKQIWPEWEIDGKSLGKGSYGIVYKAVRRDHNVESHAAIKVISIPSDSSEVDSLRSEGLDMNATRTYLQGIVDDFVSEIQLMESLKGVQNIVSVEDYKVVEKKDEIGWDIYIRMELLTSFNTYICDKKLTEEEVIKLGCDICTALEICTKRNIIHRDIKPANIFINDFGYFKLGDFGIARKMENLSGGLSQKGTPDYMAPEIANNSEYDERVDIYSLGLVLYRLLNNNKPPFLNTEKQLLSPNERKTAWDRRIRGEELPAPCEASPAMADLILRACAYDPSMRFASATEMKQALMSVSNGTYQGDGNAKYERTMSVRRTADSFDKTTSVRKAVTPPNQESSQSIGVIGNVVKKKNSVHKIVAVVLAVLVIFGVGSIFIIKQFEERKAILTIIEDAEVLADSAELEAAIAKIEEGLEEFPDSDELSDKLIEYKEELPKHQITVIMAEAESSALAGNYEGAIGKITKGLEEHPESKELQDKLDEYTNGLAQQQITDAISASDVAAKDGDYEEAVDIITSCLEKYPSTSELQTKLDEYNSVQQQIANTISEADIVATDGGYEEAIAILTSGLEKHPNSKALQKKLDECNVAFVEQKVALVIAEAEEYATAEEYEEAVKIIQVGLVTYPDSTILQEKQEEYNVIIEAKMRAQDLVNAASLADLGDFAGAIQLLENYTDAEVIVTRRDYENNYEQQVISIVDSKMSERDYTGAISELENAKKIIPNSEVITNKMTDVQSRKPCAISKLALIDRDKWLVNDGNPIDIFGNSHESEYTCVLYNTSSWYYRTPYAEYRSYKEYSTLTGIISPYQNIEDECFFKIYLDDVLVKTYEIGKKTDPISFAIDISDADYIRFEVDLYAYSGVILSDVLLWTE